jgi:ectoine hydroxylase-related dioxygenase (phytanoyl-CoA dioxygenase family)
MVERVEVDGYAMVPDFLDASRVRSLTSALDENVTATAGRGGRRNLLDEPVVRELAYSDEIRRLVSPILGDDAFVVRGILFDKTEGANWKVPWHQDVTIAVKHRVEIDGFGPWSTKQGVLHVQPPDHVLQKMLSVRIHLDDCPATNGALRVIPGSHRNGKLAETAIAGVIQGRVAVTCEMRPGGALLMRPLLIHSSSASETPAHRRVVHLDYANVALPDGLSWFENLVSSFDVVS